MTTQDRTPTQKELEAGYALARDMYGENYAEYLRRHTAELLAKGYTPKPWPESLVGNDGH